MFRTHILEVIRTDGASIHANRIKKFGEKKVPIMSKILCHSSLVIEKNIFIHIRKIIGVSSY